MQPMITIVHRIVFCSETFQPHPSEAPGLSLSLSLCLSSRPDLSSLDLSFSPTVRPTAVIPCVLSRSKIIYRDVDISFSSYNTVTLH